MTAKFGLYLLSIASVINHAYYAMARFVIFKLGKIDPCWSWFLDMFLVRVHNCYGKNFTCSTGHFESRINMQAHLKLNA